MKTLRTCLVSLSALVAVACGETPDGPDQTAPLAHVNGTIVASNGVTVQGDLRMAIVWYPFDQDNWRAITVTQDVDVAPQLPASFTLTLTDPPPAEALVTAYQKRRTDDSIGPIGTESVEASFRLPGSLGLLGEGGEEAGPLDSMRGAFGRLVAYEDRNANGKLDTSKQGDGAYIDRVVGSLGGDDQDTYVVWVEPGDVAAVGEAFRGADGSMPTAGYTMWRDDLPYERQWVSTEVPVEVALDDSSRMQLLLCSDGARAPVTEGPTEIPEWPGPGDESLPEKGDPGLNCHVSTVPDASGQSTPMAWYSWCENPTAVCVSDPPCNERMWRKPSDPAKAVNWPCDT